VEVQELKVAAGFAHRELDHEATDIGVAASASAEEGRAAAQVGKVLDG